MLFAVAPLTMMGTFPSFCIRKYCEGATTPSTFPIIKWRLVLVIVVESGLPFTPVESVWYNEKATVVGETADV